MDSTTVLEREEEVLEGRRPPMRGTGKARPDGLGLAAWVAARSRPWAVELDEAVGPLIWRQLAAASYARGPWDRIRMPRLVHTGRVWIKD